METETLKRILLIYNIVLMIISGLAIFIGVLIFLVSLLPLISWFVPTSVGFSAIGGGVIVLVVALLGCFACWDKGRGGKRILPWHIAGLVIIIVIELYIAYVLLYNHAGFSFSPPPFFDPLGIVYNLFGGYTSIIRFSGKYFGFLAILLTIPQVLAVAVAVLIQKAKTNLLPITLRFRR